MNADDAVRVALEIAKAEGWAWLEPVRVVRERRWILFGHVQWRVVSNSERIGSNVNVLIDDKSGAIIQKGFAPR